jgi:type II secretory ATPase GspE/PulE/Tfp pilus assembly ATPase PilB-like protein
MVPEQVARRYQIVPLHATDTYLEIATANPYDIDCENTLAFATSREIRMLLATPTAIAEKLDELYRPESVIDQLLQGMAGGPEVTHVKEHEAPAVDTLAREATLAPVVKLVDHLLTEGIRSRASDIHIEPEQNNIVVRYRIDGVLRQVMSLPRRVGLPLISRIKIMSRLDIADRLRPQDGRARVAVGGKPVDLRVSTLPAALGEKVVIRILDSSKTILELDRMGLNPAEAQGVKDLLGNRDGVILVTGPTGSGKTTTLYSAIGHVQSEGVNIITVEDPVEYRLKGIVQVQVHEKAGLTFASALRSILRQDPDVVLVGEIRDRETAQIAVQASLTGHLVLSTLHTNDASSAVARLMDIGIEGYKIATAVRGVLAQRLMRRLCSNCKDIALEPVPRKLQHWVTADATLYRAVGCPKCAMTGYRGRFAILEVLRVTPEVERLIAAGETADRIAQAARESGMNTLWESGLSHVLRGESTVDELLRVVDVPADHIRPQPTAAASGPALEAPVVEPPAQETFTDQTPPPEMRFSHEDPNQYANGHEQQGPGPGRGNIHIGPTGGNPETMEVRLDSGHGVKSVQVPPDVKVMVVYMEDGYHSQPGGQQHAYYGAAPGAQPYGQPMMHPQPMMPPWPQTPPIAAQYSHAVIYQPTPMPGHYPGVFQYAPYAWGPTGMGPVYQPSPGWAPGGFGPTPPPPQYQQGPVQWVYTNAANQPPPQAAGRGPARGQHQPPHQYQAPPHQQSAQQPVGAGAPTDGRSAHDSAWSPPANGHAQTGHHQPPHAPANGTPPQANGAVNQPPNWQPKPNGAYPNGAHPNGGYPNGAYPNGAYPNGAYPNGAHPTANGGVHQAPLANTPNGTPYANGSVHHAPPTGHANGTTYHAPHPNGPAPNGVSHPAPPANGQTGANGVTGYASHPGAPPQKPSDPRQDRMDTNEMLETKQRERRVAQRRKLSTWGVRVDRRSGQDRRATYERRVTDRRRLSAPVAFERRAGSERRMIERRAGVSRRCGFERRMNSERRNIA